MKHLTPSAFRKRAVSIDLIGCGGTGSQLLTELARLHVALRHSGHPAGLQVNVFDPDVVSEANVARTLFGPSDIGQYKASVLVTRVNVVYGLMFRGLPQRYVHPYWHMERQGAPPDVVITAVDNLKTRAELYGQMLHSETAPPRYWLDLGNAEETGQVILGEVEWALDPDLPRDPRKRLRNVVDFFPEMLARVEAEEPDDPSCSLAGALGKQDLFINRHLSTWGAEILWRLFRSGGLDYHGVFINARSGRVNPIAVGGPAVRPLPAATAPLAPGRRRRLRSGVAR